MSDTAFRFDCAACGSSSPDIPSRAEAADHADAHERTLHDCEPTTTTHATARLVEPGIVMCESCRHRPATTTWAHDEAGDPFTLCADCAALIPVTVATARPSLRRSR